MRFNPGPGWGGHCIPLDPFYLTWKAREFGKAAKFIELAGEINTDMPHWVIGKMQMGLNEACKSVKGSRVLILGMAYKKNIDDIRESPALEIMDILDGLGAVFDYHDPHVPEVPGSRKHLERRGIKSITLTPENVASYDAVIIVTDHSAVDYLMVAVHAQLIIDSRGVYERLKDLPAALAAKIIRA
jgi:UDP-N-acetyl-D-glucosamine dehydrogenase